MKVLIVEDNHNELLLLNELLIFNDYETCTATNGMEGLKVFNENEVDIVILDLKMPKMTGQKLISEIRKIDKIIPIIILTGNNSEEAEEECFKLTADDFITKPFRVTSLIARVANAVNHIRTSTNQRKFEFKDLRIDYDKYEVRFANSCLNFTKIEFRILKILTQSPGKIFPYEELIGLIWDMGYGSKESLKEHVKRIRFKIGDDSKNPTYIENIFNVGYRFYTK